ncbi:YdcH family protein [Limnobacter sp. YS8-69]|uniref:YdcH family protein n=2 Tax=Burkholderiaceae TaxID=119060 RepID=A0ABT1XN60_9BURK|nr:YdcH family protein [Limnobacter parvus]
MCNTSSWLKFIPMVHTEDIESIKRRIVELQVEHRDLDQIIAMLTAQPGFDQLQIRRLKKRKLQIKDSITLLQIQLEPDIPA